MELAPGEEWPSSDRWIALAQRRGSLRWSELGPRRLDPPPVGLAGWLAGAIDGWWSDAGRPDPWTVIIASGDDGTLARSVLERGLACAGALRYVLVGSGDVSAVAVEEPSFLYPLGDAVDEDDPDARPGLARGVGPLVTAVPDLPALVGLASSHGPLPAAVVAVGLLSRLESDHFGCINGRWVEYRLTAPPDGTRLEEVAVPLGGAATSEVASLFSSRPLPADGRYRRTVGASDWLRRALACVAGGVLAVVDDWSDPGLDLEQLRRIRQPVAPAPESVSGDVSVVEWRIG